MSTLPVEVTDTDHSAPKLASYPLTLSREKWPFHEAPLISGRSELPVPMVMVSCWVPGGPGGWPRLLSCGVICTVKGYVPAWVGVPLMNHSPHGFRPNCSPGGRLPLATLMM